MLARAIKATVVASRSLTRSSATSSLRSINTAAQSAPTPASSGSIADVFATLSGGSLEDALPPRFSQLKRQIVNSEPGFQAHLEQSWRTLLPRLSSELDDISHLQQQVFPSIEAGQNLDSSAVAEIKKRGVVVIRNVVPSSQALEWKDSIRRYASSNHATGFPADDPQVYELYWSRAQVAARSHSEVLRVSREMLKMWHRPAPEEELGVEQLADMETPLSYADRLRIRHPGDAKFALGPHIDGGGVERWEDPTFLSIWQDILSPRGQGWTRFDNWSLGPRGERMTARTAMYNGPGQCSVFRPWQGWLSLSHTGPNEGTLRVLPNLKEATAYIVMRPFIEAVRPREACRSTEEYLDAGNWRFDGQSPRFPGCSLGHNIELSSATHPHLRLHSSMISLCDVQPGDMVLWSCDAVHAVESRHAGRGDSSVMYIPAIPLTANNWRYVRAQADCFKQGKPPSDFPQGQGESNFTQAGGRAKPQDVSNDMARTAMGLETPPNVETADEGTKKLRAWCAGE